MNRHLLGAALALSWGGVALAQPMDHTMHGAPAADPHAGHVMPAPAPAPAADPHAGHSMAPASPAPTTPAPSAPTDHLADRFYDPAAMAAARRQLRLEHGGAQASQVMVSLLERQQRSGEDGYRWEGEAWFGGDIHRLVLKTEGEGGDHEGVDHAEVQSLYSRAIGPYFDLQAGVRQDLEPRALTYATVGVEGLAPYWFDVGAAAYLSTEGDLLGRVEGSYDLRLTQALILQPRLEVNLSAQDVPKTATGSGVTDAELGLRLRYEITRQFAPYVGVSWERKFGGSADFARAAGERSRSTSLVVGLRAWF